MKKFLLLLFSFVIGVALFIWVAKTAGFQELKKDILVLGGKEGIIIIGLSLLIAGLGAWKWKEILKGEGIDISFKNLIGPHLSGFSIMFLAPILLWAAEIFRGYVIKKRNAVPWSKGMASVIIEKILDWTVNLIVILIGSLFFFSSMGLPPIDLVFIFGGVILVFFAGLFFFYFRCIKRKSIVGFFIKNDKNKILEIEREIFDFFKKGGPYVWRSVFLAFLKTAAMYVRVWFLILFLGKTISALPALAILGFYYLAVMIPIPAALGSHEAIQIFAFNFFGLGISTAAAFTMITRVADLLVAILGIAILFRLGIILLKDAFLKIVDNMGEKGENNV